MKKSTNITQQKMASIRKEDNGSHFLMVTNHVPKPQLIT